MESVYAIAASAKTFLQNGVRRSGADPRSDQADPTRDPVNVRVDR
jgi:hypothetical protein